jgi:4-amino-4-deoxy-L-arabinose transferase-like glycosyltransferase
LTKSTELQLNQQPVIVARRAFSWALVASLAPTLLLTLAVGMGLFLRLWQINALGYNSDEAVYAGQAAALVGDAELKAFFPLFRAHPMLYQYILALAFSYGVVDVVGRIVTALVGVATVYVTYLTGKTLYTPLVGGWAALFVALMPYQVIVTRQVLLDGPMTFCATLTLYLLARFGQTQRPVWLLAAGAGMGLTFLTKETGIIFLGAIYVFLALSPQIQVRIRDLVLSTGCMALVMAAYPLAPRLAGAGGSKTTGQYIIWQLFRRPNHDWTFYPTTVPLVIGPLLLILAVMTLWWLRRRYTWRETLLIAWITVPTVFFQLWPVKGFHYLLPIGMPIAILGAYMVTLPWFEPALRVRQWRLWTPPPLTQSLLTLLVALSLFWGSWGYIQIVHADQVLAGAGGVPGGRELGTWLRTHTPEGAIFMTLGPSMANLVQFYGDRKGYGLSVSPNPLHRNPSYEPIINPDYLLRTGEIHYIIWDSFSASRSTFFEQKLFTYIDRYHGQVVHTQTVTAPTPGGGLTEKPIIKVYEVRP